MRWVMAHTLVPIFNIHLEGIALETAGAVAKARHLLGNQAFVAISADVYCPHFDFTQVTNVLEDNDIWASPSRATNATSPGCTWSKTRRTIPRGFRAAQLFRQQ